MNNPCARCRMTATEKATCCGCPERLAWEQKGQTMNDREMVVGWLEALTDDNWCKSYSNSEVQSIAEAALELLKKPKKVKTDMYGDAYCPHCSTVSSRAMGVQRLHMGTRFCPYCGQPIEWE